MKKHILQLFIVIAPILASCTQHPSDNVSNMVTGNEKAIAELTEAARTVCKSCPIKTDDNMVLEGATFSHNQWTYHYVVKEDSVVNFNLADQNASIREGLKQSTQRHITESIDMITMLRALVQANADLIYEYRGNESGKTIKVQFTFAEIRVMVDAMTNYYSNMHRMHGSPYK